MLAFAFLPGRAEAQRETSHVRAGMDGKSVSLYEALNKRGYPIRQHVEEVKWGARKPTVIDLDMLQSRALEHGGVQGLKEALDSQLYRPPWGLFTFPALDIESPLPRSRDLLLARNGVPTASVAAPGKNPVLWAMAQECVDTIKDRYAIQLPLIDDEDAKTDLLATRHLVLFGGGHQSRLALELALRYRTFFVDASVPGEDGWVVTTHCGIHASGHNIAQVAAPAAHRKTVLALLLEAVAVEGDDLILRHIHRIHPGKVMAAHFPSWETFTAPHGRRRQSKGQGEDAPQDIKALADQIALGLDSGGFEKNRYNIAPVDIAIGCARYYQLSADPRALALFRELLIRLADYYLKTPGGASYPSDLDFRLGMLILHYARLEHEPVFDEEDRLILTNLLLACTRSIHEYAAKGWPAKENTPRHNHQTFPALSLLYAADYFSRFNLPYVKDWLAYTESIFDCDLWNRSKQRENARSYEPFVFNHAAAYAFFTGRGLATFGKGCFERMTERQIAATDNFFRPVDYGDSRISMQPADSLSARFLATRQDGLMRWFAGEGFARNPRYTSYGVSDFPGLRMGPSQAPRLTGDWEYIPLAPAFLEEVNPGFPHEFSFDKLAFRTGWSDEDQYLLLEGVGGAVSHSHNEANGIVRLNHLGRHWIVSNGYGRRVGVRNVLRSFSTRERGPEDHNMLVVRRAGGIARDLPMSALLQRGREGQMLYATGAVLDYGGVNWFRTTLIYAGHYVLAIDRVQVVQPGLERAHVEWNGLGQTSARKNGFRLEQKGVFLDVTSASGWRAEQKVTDQSADWKRVLGRGSYPFATFPLAKLVFHLPGVGAGQTHCLATLLAATRSEAEYTISQPEPGRILVAGPHEHDQGLKMEDLDLAVRIDHAGCEVRFAPAPEIPKPLENWLLGRSASKKE